VIAPVDPNGVRQVLLNLLDNAAKYGPAGQTIGVGLALTDGSACLWVEDEGPGIPAHDRDRVWQPFARLDRDIDASVAGSGIGLSVVRDIVRQHGGRARVESTGTGSARIVVELPGARGRDSSSVRSACAS
jgi:signal transduction histidine kinase